MRPPISHDLEVIVTLLELGALSLTTHPEARFTFRQLLAEANSFGGAEVAICEREARPTAMRMKFIRDRLSRDCHVTPPKEHPC